MGMHQIESLVEESVRLLDRGAHNRSLDMRSLLWNLYDYQRGYDTGNTLFRVATILVRHRYLYAFPLSEHPDYLRHPDYFTALKSRGFEEIPVDPGKSWHDEKNPTAGYFCDPVREWGASFSEKNDWGDLALPLLYCEAGSPLWKQFVASKALTGSDAKQPERIDRSNLFHSVIQEALRQGDDKLAAEWYQVGIPYEFGSADSKDGARLKNDSHLIKIREIARKHRLHALPVDRGFHEAEDVDLDNPFLTWWWADFLAEDENDGDRART